MLSVLSISTRLSYLAPFEIENLNKNSSNDFDLEVIFYENFRKLRLLQKIIENKIINKKTLLNINIPDSNNLIKDFKYTRLGKIGIPVPAKKIKEKNLYNIGAAGDPKDDGEGTDFFATNNNIISITPITYDLTNSKILEELNYS